jgi:hypothetical protein
VSEHYLISHPKSLQCQECGEFYDVLEGHKECQGKPGWLSDAEREIRFRINKPLSGKDVALQFQTEIQPHFDEHVTTFAHRQQRIGYWVWIVAGELCLSSFEITEHAWLQDRDAMFKRAEDARLRLMLFVKSAIQAARVRNEPGVAAVPEGGLIPLPGRE